MSLRAAGQARLEALVVTISQCLGEDVEANDFRTMTVPASTMFETFGGYPMEFFRQISLIAEECLI